MLQPKRLKHRKQFRGKMPGLSFRGSTINFGDFGLKALEVGWVTSNQIEAARVAIGRHTKKGGKLWIRIFPDKPITSKGAEATLGGGKGDVVNYVAVVRPGRIMFEVSGLEKDLATYALTQAGHKLPMQTKIIAK